MLIKFLFILLALAVFRFLVRLARTLLRSTRSPEIHSRRSPDTHPARDKPVVDVEFTEEKTEDKRTEDAE